MGNGWQSALACMAEPKRKRIIIPIMPEYAGVEEFAHVQSGGQSPVEKYLALTNMEAGVKAVEYFIRTGKLYPGIDWAEQI